MVQLAIANDVEFGLIVQDEQDLGLSVTWPRIQSRFLGAELFMLIGNNPVRRLSTWPHRTEFGRQPPTFIISKRDKPAEEVKTAIQTLLDTKKYSLPYSILEAEYQTHSSQAIRLAVKGKQRPEGLPEAVLEYIYLNKLYQSTQL